MDNPSRPLFSDGSLRVWALASGLPIAQAPGAGADRCGGFHRGPWSTENFIACAASGATALVDLSSRWVLERVARRI